MSALQAGCRWFEPGIAHGRQDLNNRQKAPSALVFRVPARTWLCTGMPGIGGDLLGYLLTFVDVTP